MEDLEEEEEEDSSVGEDSAKGKREDLEAEKEVSEVEEEDLAVDSRKGREDSEVEEEDLAVDSRKGREDSEEGLVVKEDSRLVDMAEAEEREDSIMDKFSFLQIYPTVCLHQRILL